MSLVHVLASTWPNIGVAIYQCFSTFVRPRPGKFFFHTTRARSQQIYSSDVYAVLRNRAVRQVYGKYAVSVPPLPSAGHWNILRAPRHNIYFGPRLCSAGLAFRGVCGCAGVRV